MNKTKMNRIYDGLSSREKAFLAFNSEAAGDFDATEDLIFTISRKRYSSLDVEYTETYDALHSVASTWAHMYWMTAAKLIACVAKFHSLPKKDSSISMMERLESYQHRLQGRLQALDLILDRLSESCGLSRESVLQMASVHTLLVDGVNESDLDEDAAEYLENVSTLFKSALNGEETPLSVVAFVKGEPEEELHQ